MKHNVGPTDTALRVVVGVILLAAIVFAEGPLRWLGLIGVVPLLTGIVGYCPLYTLFGCATCQMENRPS